MPATLFALIAALTAPPAGGELMWWAPDAPATGIAVRGPGVQRGLGTGRSEWWPMDGNPPRLLPVTTRCPSAGQRFDPPLPELPGKVMPWGPVTAAAQSADGFCTLTASVSGPLVLYRRDRVLTVFDRAEAALGVSVASDCARGVSVDEKAIEIFPLTDGATETVRIPVDLPPVAVALTPDAVVAVAADGTVDVYRPDGQKRTSVDAGAPIGCATATDRVFVGETEDARTRAYALSDGSLRWGRPAVDGELGDEWRSEPPQTVSAMRVDPTGRWIATLVDGTVRLWRPDAGPPVALPELDDAIDVAAAPDGRHLAVRRATNLEIWRVDSDAPRRVSTHRVPTPPDPMWGPTVGWIDERAWVVLTPTTVVASANLDAGELHLEDPRALVVHAGRVSVVTRQGVQPLRVQRSGRGVALRRGRFRRHPGPAPTAARGAREACDGQVMLHHPDGVWRRWGSAEQGDIDLCVKGGRVGLTASGTSLTASHVVRGKGPPTRHELPLPLYGAATELALDPMGRVTALLDGVAVVRWQPGAADRRRTWVVVDGRDVVASPRGVFGPRAARRSLGWWRPEGVESAADAPTLDWSAFGPRDAE